jgi:V/A-type H+/Na+-transporting ATPase subunit E
MEANNMPKPEHNITGTGVQELVDRIRNQGVLEATEQANQILRAAETTSAKMLSDTRLEVERMHEQARTEIASNHAAALEALKLSARDTVLHLESKVSSAFEVFVQRLVTSATCDEQFIQAMVLVLAGHVEKELIGDNEIKILISESLLNGQANEKLNALAKQSILALSSEMLREGVELVPSSEIQGGASVRLVNEKLEIDLSDKAIAKLLYQRCLPRFKAIFEGSE